MRVRTSNCAHKAFKCFSGHFFLLSIYSQNKSRFLLKVEFQRETPFFARNVVLACSSLHYFTVQMYTSWRLSGLSFAYETSLTIRWLKEEKMKENCHLLTTSFLNKFADKEKICIMSIGVILELRIENNALSNDI